jgi:hypothetical protein
MLEIGNVFGGSVEVNALTAHAAAAIPKAPPIDDINTLSTSS